MNAKITMDAIRALCAVGAAVLLGLALVGLPGTAAAQPPAPRQPVALTVAGPEDVPLGNLARIMVLLRDGAGNPIANARIVFTSPARFAGTVGEMALGEAVTDATGVATLDEQLRIEGPNQIIARFYGDDTRQPAQATTVIQATGRAQLVQRSAGLQVPLLGSWTLIIVIGAVWAVYFLAMLLVTGIPERQEVRPEAAPGGER